MEQQRSMSLFSITRCLATDIKPLAIGEELKRI